MEIVIAVGIGIAFVVVGLVCGIAVFKSFK